MRLEPSESKRFFSIWFPLLHYVNVTRKIVPSFPSQWKEGVSVDLNSAMLLRDALWSDDTLRTAFIAENPAELPPEDLAVVDGWQHRIFGTFIVYLHFRRYSILLSADEESATQAYGVIGLMESLRAVTHDMPVIAQTALIPFEGRIIYDGILAGEPVQLGKNILRGLEVEYREIKKNGGVITSLPPQ